MPRGSVFQPRRFPAGWGKIQNFGNCRTLDGNGRDCAPHRHGIVNIGPKSAFHSFKVGAVPEHKRGEAGDVWTWTALDADSKLIVSWAVGGRDSEYAMAFMELRHCRVFGRHYEESTGDRRGAENSRVPTFGRRRTRCNAMCRRNRCTVCRGRLRYCGPLIKPSRRETNLLLPKERLTAPERMRSATTPVRHFHTHQGFLRNHTFEL